VALTSPDALDDAALDLGSIDVDDLAAEPAEVTVQPRGMVEQAAQVKLGKSGSVPVLPCPMASGRPDRCPVDLDTADGI
jgi:hypothetical protein